MNSILEPPGTIAVIGGGPLGIEAALYGRYLGYQVTLFEAGRLAASLAADPTAIPPETCVSALGLAALAAQRTVGGTMITVKPTSHADWLSEYFEQLAEVDLLAGRIRLGVEVTRIDWAPPELEGAELEGPEADEPEADEPEPDGLADEQAEEDAEDDAAAEIPPDFLVFVRQRNVWGEVIADENVDGEQAEESVGGRFEAVIDARGAAAASLGPIATDAQPLAYYFRLGEQPVRADAYAAGLRQICEIFAALQDRPGLDVYKNLGG
ncbi:hypothetical protein SH139x_001446 [Planctomycetaceae bacterium SH139]